MTYQEAMDYLESCSGLGIVPGLDSIRELLRRLGNPQDELNCIHLAGTNGKGSVTAFLSSVLKEAGYRVGAYVSPVVFTYEERFQLQGKPVPRRETVRLVEAVAAAAQSMVEDGLPHPTSFELETAMGFILFHQKKCDIAIIETGMGGRLDATNILKKPFLTVITPISMDHMAFLGDTLEAIAGEKAGIMKPQDVVVSAAQAPEAAAVLQRQAERIGVRKFRLVNREEIRGRSRSLARQTVAYGGFSRIEITLPGLYQQENAALALEAVNALECLGVGVKEEALRRGMKKAFWPGRFQLIRKNPVFIADGAHNEAGAEALRASLEFYFTNRRIIYIIGMFRDKEAGKAVARTAPLAEHIITTAARGNPRALSPLELAKLAGEHHLRVTAADSVQEAVELALLLAGKEGVIVAFGSLAWLGECIRIVENKQEMREDTHGQSRKN